MADRLRVAVNGYGTIGERVAMAVHRQPDMHLVGVTKRTPTFEARLADGRGVRFFGPMGGGTESEVAFAAAGIKLAGTFEEMLRHTDVVVDCLPQNKKDKEAKERKDRYTDAKVKAIFQGGEKAKVGVSFGGIWNWDAVADAPFTRVVSCNTTGISTVTNIVQETFGVESGEAVLVRRAADPSETDKGPIDSIVPDGVSHHGEDVMSVLGGFPMQSVAFTVSSTHAHCHYLKLKLKEAPGEGDVRKALRANPRVMMVSKADGVDGTAQIKEIGKRLGRKMGDVYETVVWEDLLELRGNALVLILGVHQEAIVIPPNIDALRAVAKMGTAAESFEATNSNLGMVGSNAFAELSRA